MKKVIVVIVLCSSFYIGARQPKNQVAKQRNQKFVLITVFDNKTNPKRMAEYMRCLECNMSHPSIDTVHVLYNTEHDNSDNRLLQHLNRLGVSITYVQSKPTFGYCFRLANSRYPNRKIIVSNPDIYFNRTLKLLEPYSLNNIFLALTRWNVGRDGRVRPLCTRHNGRYIPNAGSQDSWVFRAPLKKLSSNNVKMGNGTIAYHAKRCGLRVVNPCLSIQCCCLDLSGMRSWEHGFSIDKKYPRVVIPWSRLGKKSAKKRKK